MSTPISEGHYRLAFSCGQTQDLPEVHGFFQTSYGQVIVRLHSINDRTIEIDKTQAAFQKYLAALDHENSNPPTEIRPADYVDVFDVADHFNDGKTIEKVKRQALNRFTAQELNQKFDAEGLSDQENKIWMQLYFQKILELPVDQWEGLLRQVALEGDNSLDEILNSLSGENQVHGASTEALRELYDYYLSKTDALDAFLGDYETIIQQAEEIRNSEEKRQFFTGLIELAARCLEKQVGKKTPNPSGTSVPRNTQQGYFFRLFGGIRDVMKLVKDAFPIGSFEDGVQAWKTIRSINKYETIREAFFSRAMDQMSQGQIVVLRGRIDHLQISLRFPWERGKVSTAIRSNLDRIKRSYLSKESKQLNQLNVTELNRRVDDRMNHLFRFVQEGNKITADIDQHRITCIRQMMIMVARVVSTLALFLSVPFFTGTLLLFSFFLKRVLIDFARGYFREAGSIMDYYYAVFFGFLYVVECSQLFISGESILKGVLRSLLLCLLSLSLFTSSKMNVNNARLIHWRHQGFSKSWLGKRIVCLSGDLSKLVNCFLKMVHPDRVQINA